MKPPIDIVPLFPVLNGQLVSFLKDLPAKDWHVQTVAREWKVKDVAAHLLDGNYRRIAVHRDGWTVSVADPINSYDDLVQYLNGLNAEWVRSAKRLSPQIIIELLEATNEEVYKIFRNLDPFAESAYPVSWAGENRSYNWFDIAREYTERWLHQQQIRDALGNKDIMTHQLYYPFLDIFMKAWPVAANGSGKEGAVLKTTITGHGGGEWLMENENGKWVLRQNKDGKNGFENILSETIIDGNVAWKLFSKSVRKQDITDSYEIKGDQQLGEKVLDMISVMA
ncbi:MAG: maleylpyruvate isomerase N-terminal domain-containing protein [Chitinophagaceae bacterium]|nr:maleylpyruvate isomerase N-terminal domain-containing protein [Chitinophagaceae bacterium]